MDKVQGDRIFIAHVTLFVFPVLVALLATPSRGAAPPLPAGELDVRNSTDEAYHLFYLALTPDDDRPSGRDEEMPTRVVFKDGTVQNNWLPEDEHHNNATAHLFHHNQYTDRVSFDFSFGSLQVYDIRKPTCSSSNTGIAKPKVVDFQIDPEEQSGSLSIVYDCHRHPDTGTLRNVTLLVVLPVVPGLSIFFSLRKTCGGGVHPHIDFGYFEESAGEMGQVERVSFSDLMNTAIVGPHVLSTKLYIHLSPPAASQEFYHISTNSSSPILSLTARGPTFGGVLKVQESALVHILYDCHGSGLVEVSVKIPIFPFHRLAGSWKKDCGGGMAQGLNIGTSLFKRRDIVDSSKTANPWKLAHQTTAGGISNNGPVFNSSVRYKDFWLSNDGITVHVAAAIVTVSDPDMLAVIASNPNGRQISEKGEFQDLMRTGSARQLRLHMICTKKGSSFVTVTFPVRSFSNIEFGFTKHCRAPQRYVHSGFLRTANSLMVALSFLMIAGFTFCWLPHYKSKTGYGQYKSVRNARGLSPVVRTRLR